MNALNSREAAAVLGVSGRALADMVRRGAVVPLPGTGGQGRRALFDAATVRAYSTNEDLAGCLARAVMRLPNVSRMAAAAWSWRYDRCNGGHILEPLAPRLNRHLGGRVRPGCVTHANGRRFDNDKLLRECRNLAASLSRRECEYAIAALISASHPTEKGFKTRGSDRASVRVLDSKLRAWRHPSNPDFFWHEFGLFLDTDHPGGLDLLSFVHAAAGWQDLPLHVQTAWKEFQAASGHFWKWSTVRKWNLARLEKCRMPPAASVGRIIGMKRAQAAKIWRTLQPRLPRWYLELFRV